jgi:hypothetical protein
MPRPKSLCDWSVTLTFSPKAEADGARVGSSVTAFPAAGRTGSLRGRGLPDAQTLGFTQPRPRPWPARGR